MTTTNLATRSDSRLLMKPEPRSGPISIRVATLGGPDLKFIDALQKKHSKMVGFLRTGDIEKYIAAGGVLIAETAAGTGETPVPPERIGYIIFKDKYLKREELGIVFQLNIMPGKQRGLVGAALVKAAFERSAYGCKLFCCWCAQDIEANRFWESLGFVPLAFRAGSRGAAHGGRRKEGRMHIFWQRRIREGDAGPGATPYWFPSETQGGAIKEGRIVLPIPPGTHWSDAKPAVLPGMEKMNEVPALEGDAPKEKNVRAPRPKGPAVPVSSIRLGGLRFAPGRKPAPNPKQAESKPKRQKQPPRKNDPTLVAAAREFRDRYLDEVNSEDGRFMLESQGKYDVSRQLPASQPSAAPALQTRQLLEAA